MRVRGFLLAVILALLVVDSSWAQRETPNRRRPYIDLPGQATTRTPGFGPLASGADPSGWLLCREGEVLVGVSFKRGRLVDRVLIHCAEVHGPYQAERPFNFPGFTWSRAAMHPPDWREHPAYKDAAAGGPGGDRVNTRNVCPEGYAISGMQARLNVRGQIEDLGFECARLIGSFTTLPTTGRVAWFTDFCQPRSSFAIFPVRECLAGGADSHLRQLPDGSHDYRFFADQDRFGANRLPRMSDVQRCRQYGAVGLVFVEEGFATFTAINTVVTSLQLVCLRNLSVLDAFRRRR
jgi:hypothetical protein